MSRRASNTSIRYIPNVRFLLLLLGIAGVSLVTVHFLHGYQIERNKAHLLARAHELAEQGSYEESGEYASRYLLLDPTNQDALYLLRESIAHAEQTPRAIMRSIQVASRVLRLDPDNYAVRRDRAAALLNPYIALYTDALIDIETLLTANPTDANGRPAVQDPELWTMAGQALQRRDAPRRAAWPDEVQQALLSNLPDAGTAPATDLVRAADCYRCALALLDAEMARAPPISPDPLGLGSVAGSALPVRFVEARRQVLDTTIALADLYRSQPQTARRGDDASAESEAQPDDAGAHEQTSTNEPPQLDDPSPPAHPADALIDGLVTRFPDWAPAYLARYSYRVEHTYGDDQQREYDLDQALRYADQGGDRNVLSDVLAAIAGYRLATADYSGAEQAIEQGLALNFDADDPDHQAFRVLRWRLVATRDGPQAALALLEPGQESAESNPALLAAIAESLIQAGRFEEAQRQIDLLERTSGDRQHAQFLHAFLLQQRGHLPEAIERFSAVQALTERDRPQLAARCHYFIGNCYERLLQPDKALPAYARACDLDPSWDAPEFARATLYQRMGRFEDALRAYARAARLVNDDEAAETAYYVLALSLRADQAVREAALATQPDDANSAAALAWNTVEQLLAEARLNLGSEVDHVLFDAQANLGYLTFAGVHRDPAARRALLSQALTRLEDAIQAMQDAVRNENLIDEDRQRLYSMIDVCRTSAAEVHDAFAQADLDDGVDHSALAAQHRQAADQTLVALEQLSVQGAASSVRILRAFRRLRQNDYEGAVEILSEDLDNRAPFDRLQLLVTLGNMALEREPPDLPQARAYFEQIRLIDDPVAQRALAWRLRLVEVLIRQRDAQALRALADEFRPIEGPTQSFSGYTDAARLIVAERPENPTEDQHYLAGLEEAARLLAAVQRQRPDWAPPYVLLGTLAEQQGRPDDALEHYERCFALNHINAFVLERRLRLLVDQGRLADAAMVLRDVEGRNRRLLEGMEHLAAGIWWANDNLQQAVSYAAIYEPRTYLDHLWRAQLFEAGERTNEAERAYEAACRMAPEEPVAWIALAMFRFRQGDQPAAESVFERARQALPPERALLAEAACCAALAEQQPLPYLRRARELYADAVQRFPDHPEIQLAAGRFLLQHGNAPGAVPLLRRAAEPPHDNPLARRLLAVALAENPTPRARAEALALLEANRNADGRFEAVADSRIRAALLIAGEHTDAELAEARALLEDIVQSREPTPQDNFNLARIYLAVAARQDDPLLAEQARRLMLDAVIYSAGQPEQLAYRAAYVTMLIDEGQFTDAETHLRHLEQAAAAQVATVVLRARLEHAMNRTDQAVERLLAFARALDPEDRALLVRLAAVVRELEDMGRSADADQLCRQWADRSPAAAMVQAAVLAARGDSSQSLDVLEPLLTEGDNATTLRIAYEVVTSADADPSDAARAEHWLSQSAENLDPDEYGIWLGNLRLVQGDYEGSAEVYHPLAQREDADPAVLNNYAWVLAEHLGRPAEALPYIDRAIQSYGEMAELLDTRGVVYFRMGGPDNLRRAAADLERAAARAPTAQTLFHLAAVYREQGDTARALETFNRAIDAGGRAAVPPDQRDAFQAFHAWVQTQPTS